MSRYVHIGPGGPRRPGLLLRMLLGLYRFRHELGLVAVGVALGKLGAATHPVVPAVLGLVVVVALGWWPGLRGWVRGRARAVLTEHRLRAAWRGAGLMSLDGRTPIILRSSPRPAGIRVMVSLPPGVDAEDLRAGREHIAVATFAADVLVERHPQYANLCVVYVVTRRPDDE